MVDGYTSWVEDMVMRYDIMTRIQYIIPEQVFYSPSSLFSSPSDGTNRGFQSELEGLYDACTVPQSHGDEIEIRVGSHADA